MSGEPLAQRLMFPVKDVFAPGADGWIFHQLCMQVASRGKIRMRDNERMRHCASMP